MNLFNSTERTLQISSSIAVHRFNMSIEDIDTNIKDSCFVIFYYICCAK